MKRHQEGCKFEKTYSYDYGTYEYDCGYNTTITCDQCMYVVGLESGDMRKGLNPSAKCNQERDN